MLSYVLIVFQLLSRLRIMEERLSRSGGTEGTDSAPSAAVAAHSTDLDSSLSDKSVDQLWEIVRYILLLPLARSNRMQYCFCFCFVFLALLLLLLFVFCFSCCCCCLYRSKINSLLIVCYFIILHTFQ